MQLLRETVTMSLNNIPVSLEYHQHFTEQKANTLGRLLFLFTLLWFKEIVNFLKILKAF